MSVASQTKVRVKPRLWWFMLVLSTLIALYGMAYVVFGERVFPPDLAESFRSHLWAIYGHAFFSAIALFIGPLQFHRDLLSRRRALHRILGKVYVIAAILGAGFSGFYLALYSFGGWVTHAGFGLLSIATTVTTFVAYLKIKDRKVAQHREWMIRSYSLIFAAVTLRIWLPLLIFWFNGNFRPAYLLVAWLSWVPNLVAAEIYLVKSKQVQATEAARLLAT
jgi:uncharacterized membrane protein